ncbi:hypothetical protein JOB18_012298 [Solea senegalensis]|nr:uncharacterized protein pdzph1 isoform X2 [Solea senegalensis]KAG7498547.1 hypothetical protein JOB18_012298 [Solea senegalensis]
MSKRGRRRNSRRKSSSSSKQSASPYIFLKQNKNNSPCYKDDVVEKGETDSLRRENVGTGSDDEEKYDNSPPQEKRYKQDYNLTSNLSQRSIYTKTTEDKETGAKIVTSVSVSDSEDLAPKITFQQRHERSSEKQTHSSTPVTNIMKIDCSGSRVKLEIQEMLNSSGVKTTFVFMNENVGGARTTFKSEGTTMPDNESSERPLLNVTHCSADQNYRFSFGGVTDRADNPAKTWYNPNCQCYTGQKQQIPTDCLSANPPPGSALQLNIKPQEKRKYFQKSFSIDQFWDIPPPQEYADIKYNTLEELRFDLASSRTGTSPTLKQWQEFHTSSNLTHNEEEQEDLPPSFDQLSESENYDPTFARPSMSTNRSSFTNEFISLQKRKSWIRNNSIAAVEHRACPYPQRRRQTFPGMSEGLGLMQEDLLLPCTESFSSLMMCSCPEQTETLEMIQQTNNDNFPDDSSQTEVSSTEPTNGYDGRQTLLSSFCTICSGDSPDAGFAICGQSRRQSTVRCSHQGFKQSSCKYMDSLDTEVADSGFEQEIGEVEFRSGDGVMEEPVRRTCAIQVIPPSCSGSEEQMPQGHQVPLFQNKEDSDSTPPKHKSSVMTLSVGTLEQRFLQMDLRSSQSGQKEISLGSSSEDIGVSPFQDRDVTAVNTREEGESESKAAGEEPGDTSTSQPLTTEETKDWRRGARRSTPTEIHAKEQLGKTNKSNKPTVSRCPSEVREHLKPVMHVEAEGGSSDHWAKRRKLFKDSKQWSSAGGSSITSDITEESVSEDTPSMDMTTRDSEDGGFYMETFHSSAWIYQGDSVDSGVISPSLNARTRAVAIRERTVKINKGSGEYPWGFRIQFSKPITVTEVDTNGAAEEAGLTVGDYVLAVNGIDVTSIPHSEAADLARQGPDVLTLTIGSDIGRRPNTPRPACRGYLHKRTQSGLIKGWRKRWFVLTHDCCLCYYRHKRDEGKRGALSAVKLEGAEVGQDSSLGKPFVFKCRPQALNRVFFFCATSNQEMKRWLEAMERAIHPITQNHVWVDVTQHNSNLPPLAVKNPECLGLLHKMDKNKDTWVQHYCILKDGCLYLYSGIRATHAHGGIYLQGYTVKEQPYAFKKSTIELKPLSDEFKTFHLCAENPNENKRWIVAIKASIKKWLPLHQVLQDYMNRPAEETRM